MGRILAIDYGKKRVGLAATDELQIIASAIGTVPTNEIWIFLKEYLAKEIVEGFVIGLPKNLDNSDTDATQPAKSFVYKLSEIYPNIPIHWIDERFTSKMAKDAMVRGGMKKKNRRVKANVDMISATIILQSFMESRENF
ncbi:Holliday junction resolvase RuvX [Flammeovirgaceae bacterium SG7u.111]|nr:Holliday junction resolvase RuvX [Flammeovirgaceae bacterium SG7u.132]WPO36713.1 Holliday junction resolvase RuvX [Flammeovirgaceae bacterium SG7u.111]